MKCKKFENDLPDWMAGRLPHQQALHMERHAQVCPVCSRARALEEDLRAQWRRMPVPQPPLPSDIWPRLAVRLAAPATAGVSPLRGRGSAALTVAATLASAALFVWYPAPGPERAMVSTPPSAASPAGEQRVVRLVDEMQRLPHPDDRDLLNEPRPNQRAMRLLLSGNEEL